MNGVKSVMKNAADAKRFDAKVAKNGKFHFNLKAGNGQVIGKSEMYESQSSCDNGIASVKKNAPGATIDDQTKA
jgi:uncharacterized protein YegP (UPF0339 family)